ncbi:MAG: hypothetical protein ACE5DX_05290 [Candidatus Dojkabacteria bacterium]
MVTPEGNPGDNLVRPTLMELMSAAVQPASTENFAQFSGLLFQRLRPNAVISLPAEIEDRIAGGNTLILPWPHISLMDVPIVVGTAGLNRPHDGRNPGQDEKSSPLTRAVVIKSPGPLMPPGSLGVWWNPRHALETLRTGVPENQFATIGNFVLNSLMSGGIVLGEKRRSGMNTRMIEEATDHLIRGGNVILWPSGTFMIGDWRKGAARMILHYIKHNHSDPLNIVYAHLATFPGSVVNGLIRKAKYPIVVDYQHGPSAEEFLQFTDGIDFNSTADSIAAAEGALGHLRVTFRAQMHGFLGKVRGAYADVVSGFNQDIDKRYRRIRSFYDLIGDIEP